ncbi:MAG: hypothetical protein ACE5K0_07460 [Candidatus Methanofastidiosia archaeon]
MADFDLEKLKREEFERKKKLLELGIDLESKERKEEEVKPSEVSEERAIPKESEEELQEESVVKEEVLEELQTLEILSIETQKTLDYFIIPQIMKNFEKAKEVLSELQSREIPRGINPELEKSIDQNIKELMGRILQVEQGDESTVKSMEFYEKLEKVLSKLSYDVVLQNREKVKSLYNILLLERNKLKRGIDSNLDKSIDDRMGALKSLIEGVEQERVSEKSQKIVFGLENLMHEGIFDPERYNELAREFQSIAPSMDDELREKIARKIRECYAVMRRLEKTGMRKEEAQSTTYEWENFKKELGLMEADLSKASPAHIFEFYDRYDGLIEIMATMDTRNIPKPEVEFAKSQLNRCYYLLDDLRKRA